MRQRRKIRTQMKIHSLKSQKDYKLQLLLSIKHLYGIITNLLKAKIIIHKFLVSSGQNLGIWSLMQSNCSSSLSNYLNFFKRFRCSFLFVILLKVSSVKSTFTPILTVEAVTSATSSRTCGGTSMITYFSSR